MSDDYIFPTDDGGLDRTKKYRLETPGFDVVGSFGGANAIVAFVVSEDGWYRRRCLYRYVGDCYEAGWRPIDDDQAHSWWEVVCLVVGMLRGGASRDRLWQILNAIDAEAIK